MSEFVLEIGKKSGWDPRYTGPSLISIKKQSLCLEFLLTQAKP
jgi:hypothetical protein